MRRIEFANFEWMDLSNPTAQELQALATEFNLDINLIEDSLEYGHLPKIEKLGSYTFYILRGISHDCEENPTTVGELSNKIAFFVNEKTLITVHRAEFEFLKRTNRPAANSEALLLELFYELLQTYVAPAQRQDEVMKQYEQDVFLRKGNAITIEALYFQRTRARLSQKILHLTQNVLSQAVVSSENATDLQDLKDTCVSLLLQYDEVVEEAAALLNAYLSITAQRSNDVMKLLTVFSAFFLPLTFIAGIYGMNFENMPELTWRYGYFLVLGLMALIIIFILVWFKRKKVL